ncbi:L-2-amino-thiazoline-4-carboxylic acid hydrolase domain-containing protein [Burkholderia pseudomallei]|nr:L-2-Amino-thiazoline-4-carboxylic acid hydrolase domain protein [Burkholderia pseudomallei MSHR4300]CAJ2748045.1 L-2-amino-thiazoline-4-carboxylic acid hydrolase domain-containing protein [Burkholderia pseudomallei]CAJ2856514.1 L-2-amino-thiazoline-4-carboxylic acid hydrolase domain-containing protein [Burkholderia pseudomallei]CAJ2874345.1 L-2-amino-thiazoline-4-carboxylic acid hydrolase domain-containing protein [Burkholderia pseudomallei]CAJ2946045.1 L-2-amino-thiazoline-4-carboxylic acid
MHAIRGAAERADSTDAARLPAVLHTLKRQGVTGAIAFGGEGNLRDPAFTIYRAGGRTWAVAGVLGGVGASGNAAACVAAGVSGSSGAVRPPGLPGFAKVANASKDASKWQPVQEADR